VTMAGSTKFATRRRFAPPQVLKERVSLAKSLRKSLMSGNLAADGAGIGRRLVERISRRTE